MLFDKNDFRKQMDERIQNEQKKSFSSVLIDDIPIWKEKGNEEGIDNIVDVIPYRAGKNDPNVKEDGWAYRLPIFVHKNVGVNEKMYLCMAAMYGKPCPICEYRKKQKDAGVEGKVYKKWFPQRRSLFNVWVQSDEEEMKKGVQIWDISDWLMWEKIEPLTKPRRGGGRIYFMEPTKEQGRSIAFIRKNISKTKVEFSARELIERDYDIPKDILDGVFKLDELLIIPDYDEIEEEFYTTIDDAPEENRGSYDNEVDNRLERSTTQRRARTRSQEPVQEQASQETNNGGRRTSRVTQARQRTQEPQQQEETKTESGAAPGTCPAGMNYGIDCDLVDECQECQVYDGCKDKYDAMLKERESKRANRSSRRR